MKFISDSNVPAAGDNRKLDLQRRSVQEFYAGVVSGVILLVMLFWFLSIAVA